MSNKAKVNILVVDDEEGMRETLGDVLEDEGYNVVLAENGYEAIQKIKKIPFSIIFMDIKMPGINGVKTFEEIKKVDPEVAVIMMTAYSVEDMIKKVLNKGAYSVIYKPFDPAKLIKIVEEVGEGKIGERK